MLLGCRACPDDFPVQLATRLPDWSAGWRCAAVYSATRLSVCRVFLRIPRARHARLVADILARISRGCYEETASVEFKLNALYAADCRILLTPQTYRTASVPQRIRRVCVACLRVYAQEPVSRYFIVHAFVISMSDCAVV